MPWGRNKLAVLEEESGSQCNCIIVGKERKHVMGREVCRNQTLPGFVGAGKEGVRFQI